MKASWGGTLALALALAASGCSSGSSSNGDGGAGGEGTGTGGNRTGSGGGLGAGGATGGASGGAMGAGGGASGGATGAGGGTAAGGSIGSGGSTGGSGGAGGTAGGAGAATGGSATGVGGKGGLTGSGGGAGKSGNAGSSGAAGKGGNGGAGTCGGNGALPATGLAVRFANAVMSRWPDPANITSQSGWEYNHGIVLRGMQQVWSHSCDPKIVSYIQKYADEFVNAAGTVNIPAAHSFDNIEPSVLLPFLYQQTGMAKYHTAADQIRARYDTIPTNADGGFWHKQTYPNQMWLDSIYMGEPFLDQYGVVFGTCGTFCSDTIFKQMLLLSQHVRDTTTGLLYHAWDDSPAGQKAAWADPTTGRSPVVWDRALGWYTMALVDMLPDLPAGANRDSLMAILTGIAGALQKDQDPASGLWFEVVDAGSMSTDWVETSGSGMFVYALKVAVNRGYLDSSYLTVANKGWQGLQTKVTTDSGGLPTITDAVGGLSVQNNYAGYVNQSTVSNSSQGLCGILLAAAEMEAQ
ncbi:MAG TPA: glycoside hydrolase family 88 protein [Polyangia bacterium]|nr:glycoside hydrolase family 88 protein [Polyangia bacterium]